MTEEKHPPLTTLQRRFVEEYIANGFKDAKDAASKAGASKSTAKNAYRAFLGSDVVRGAINEAKEIFKHAARDRISGHADDAINALLDTLNNTFASSAGARVSAAKALLEMAGISEPIVFAGKVDVDVSDAGRAFIDELHRLRAEAVEDRRETPEE